MCYMGFKFGEVITISIETEIGQIDAPAFYVSEDGGYGHIVISKSDGTAPCWSDSLVHVDSDMRLTSVICRFVDYAN